jgi:transcriptional regulator with XRE-family HTH domain
MGTNFKTFMADQLAIPEVREEYDRLTPKYALIREIVERRIELNLSQSELASKIGTRQPAISRLEAGDNVKLETLLKVAGALGLTISLSKTHQPCKTLPSESENTLIYAEA